MTKDFKILLLYLILKHHHHLQTFKIFASVSRNEAVESFITEELVKGNPKNNPIECFLIALEEKQLL